MPTVIIRKHPTKQEIEVEPSTIVVRTDEKLTFKISGDHGFEPGTKVKILFQPLYRVMPLVQLERAATQRGPFARSADARRNPADGHFELDAEGEVESGTVVDEPWSLLAHSWKYEVSWSGLPDLDPIVKIEKGG